MEYVKRNLSLRAPGPIGVETPDAGAFTTLKVATFRPMINSGTSQRRKYIENSDGVGSSINPFNIPQQSAEIVGTRTSATVFTQTEGTWTVSALVGQYAFSYAAGTPDSGIWLPIVANDATTLTITGALHATGTAVKTCPFKSVYATYAHGQGVTAFIGGVFDGESIWLVPYSSSNLAKVNPATGGMTTYAHGQGASAFFGGVFDGESIWLVPNGSSNLVKVNPATGGMTTYAHGQGASAFYGGVFDGESVWLVPLCSSNLVKVNPPHGGYKSTLTAALTTLTFTAPGTPDYAIADLVAGGYGFVAKDEGNTVLSVIANLQTRILALERRLMK
ncbi:MAG: hypothetical protein Q8J68_14740 [Methanolobus sp.]|uniref:hypothetical protein n=1 Tax=Methanolobus sp. TaxID=1874737 RepID=UPI0027304BB0|nr:hypothetical protein [Methanolobus sp.]MDP2218532.1 hypothetical protein [Methanolobus sp.]